MTDPCQHPEFAANVNVRRLTHGDRAEVINFLAEVSVRCIACGEAFRFLGPPTGLSWSHPTVDVLATELRCPIAPGPRSIEDVPSTIRFEVA